MTAKDTRKQGPHWRLLAFLGLIWVFLDQMTKLLALKHLAQVPLAEIIPDFFNLVLVFNRGAAFGFLNDPDIDWQFWLFSGATVIGCGLIVYLMRSLPPGRLLTFGLSGILGGAIGNFIDRVRLRAVVDFLDFHIGDLHWPAFNVADIGICVGAGLVFISLWKNNGSQALSHERDAKNNSSARR